MDGVNGSGSGRARISEDLLFRPHSYDNKKYLSMTIKDELNI